MSLRRSLSFGTFALVSLACPASALAADLILNGTTVSLGGVQTYGVVSLTNGAKITVPAYNGTDAVNTGNLVLKANSITIDASSSIIAKGTGYQASLCSNGTGPNTTAGGRGGCSVRDSAGGGGHFGPGGRGTKDSPASFPAGYEEDCNGAPNAGLTACLSTTDCRNGDGLPSVAGLSFFHSIYQNQFGAAGGDKGCRDNDGFTGGNDGGAKGRGGNGGGRIVLFAANAGQTGTLNIAGRINANGNRGCAAGNDSAGGGAGGTLLLIGDTVTIASTANISAAGGRGGDAQIKCLPCATTADCGGTGQTCNGGVCGPCNCTPCTTNAQCNTGLGQTCKALPGITGTNGNTFNYCTNASNQCTPIEAGYDEAECTGGQNAGLCDDCAGGGGGGIVNVQSRVASINPAAKFDVSGALGGICPICTGEAGGGVGELQIDSAYVGEICDGFDNDFNGTADDGLPQLNCNGNLIPSCVNGVPQTCPANVPSCIGTVTDTRPRFLVILDTSGSMLDDSAGVPTFGDGSVGHIGVDTNSDADSVDGNNSRLFIAKDALTNVLSAFTNADFALARYHQDVSTNRSCQTANWFECQNLCCSYDDPRNNTSPAYVPGNSGQFCNLESLYPVGSTATTVYPAALNSNINVAWPNQNDCINYAGTCGAPRRGADVVVGFGKPLEQQLMWLDGKETNFNSSTLPGDNCSFASGGDCELRATGPRRLSRARCKRCKTT